MATAPTPQITHPPARTPEPIAIRVSKLSKQFSTVRALDSVSFSVPAGVSIGLLGGNGAGKTTTIALLLGLLLPTSGSVEVLGVDMLRDRYHVLPRLNLSSPYIDLPRRLTSEQNLRVYAQLYGLDRVRERIAHLSDALDLDSFLKRPMGSLSSGQKSRVSLAKALLNDPELLFLDEPTASMDPDSADRIRSYLEAYRHQTGATFLLASHNMGEVERMCNDVIILKAGRIVDRDSPAALLSRHGRGTLEQVFLDISRGDGTEVVQ